MWIVIISSSLPAGAAITQTQSTLIFNVREFGARGDNHSDDAQAIQAAINAASARGGEVVIPNGRYLLRSKLNINAKNVRLRGEGFSSQLFFENPAGIGEGISVNSATDVQISNLRVTGSNVPTLSRGIFITSSSHVTLDHVWESGAKLPPQSGPLVGIGSARSTDIWITNCDVSDNGYATGLDVFNDSYDIVNYSGITSSIHFNHDRVHDSLTAFSIQLIDANDSEATDNNIDQNNKLGTNRAASGYGLTAYGSTRTIANIHFERNSINNTAGCGIYAVAVDHLVLTDNSVQLAAQKQIRTSLPVAGIALNEVNDGTITGGAVIRSSQVGIEIANGRRNVIKDVKITSPVSDGVKFVATSDLTITGAIIERAGGQGIYAPVGSTESNINIVETVITMPSGQGIYLDLVKDSTVANNTIVSAAAKALLVTNPETARLKVTANIIKGVPANQTGIVIYGSNHLIDKNALTAASSRDSIGIDTNNATSDSVISNNIVSGFGVGIFGQGGQRNEIRSNRLAGNSVPLNTSPTTRSIDNH